MQILFVQFGFQIMIAYDTTDDCLTLAVVWLLIHLHLLSGHVGWITNGPRREKTCLRGFANNKGADQPSHTCSLISAFVIHLLQSIISRLAWSAISIF